MVLSIHDIFAQNIRKHIFLHNPHFTRVLQIISSWCCRFTIFSHRTLGNIFLRTIHTSQGCCKLMFFVQ